MIDKERLVMRAIRALKSRTSGSALVETALTFPILIGLLLGAVEFGDLAFKSIQVTGAARAAAQYAAMNGGNYMDTRSGGGIQLAAQNEAPWAYSKCSSFTVSESSLSCACSDGTACSGAAGSWSCTTGKPVVTVGISTTAVCAPVAKVPGLFTSSFTLHGYAQQKVLP
jgi:Flp pilus assembly protein TadG